MKTTQFRVWLQHKWFEHTDELDSIGQTVDYSSGDYFRKYKHWLRREYRYQLRNSDV